MKDSNICMINSPSLSKDAQDGISEEVDQRGTQDCKEISEME